MADPRARRAVAEEQRGRGLAKLALGTLAALGVLVDADVRARPQTRPSSRGR